MNKLISVLALSLIALTTVFAVRPQAAEAQLSDRIRFVVWNDANCDGMRQDSEALVSHINVVLRWAGSNGVIDATDREIDVTAALAGEYRFDKGGAGYQYFISIRSDERAANPVLTGMQPTAYLTGSDPTRDNHLRNDLLPGTDLWATPVFTMPEDGSVLEHQDIGLCNPANLNLPNKLYLPTLFSN